MAPIPVARDALEGGTLRPKTRAAYGYGGQEPTRLVDPTGMQMSSAEFGVAVAIGGFVTGLHAGLYTHRARTGEFGFDGDAAWDGFVYGVNGTAISMKGGAVASRALGGLGRFLAGTSFGKAFIKAITGKVTAEGAVSLGKYRLSQTVANHLDDLVLRGRFKGEPARPYLNSRQVLEEIVASGKGLPDPGGVPGALRWEVPGTFRGSQGVWEVVVDSADTVLHWNFVTP